MCITIFVCEVKYKHFVLFFVKKPNYVEVKNKIKDLFN